MFLAMIEAQGIAKRFGDVVAVRAISLRAPRGEVTGLLGPNGAGKTTAMRMVSGLLTPDTGSVTVDGVDVHAEPFVARRRIGVLPDSRGLYPRLTAREHLAYFGRLHGLSEPAIAARTDALVAQLGMAEIIDRRVAGFSQGERIQEVVEEKSHVVDVRGATVIDLIYAIILYIFKIQSKVPMSTTWVFVGLLAGREIAMATRGCGVEGRDWLGALRLAGRDLLYVVIGFLISLVLAALINPTVGQALVGN